MGADGEQRFMVADAVQADLFQVLDRAGQPQRRDNGWRAGFELGGQFRRLESLQASRGGSCCRRPRNGGMASSSASRPYRTPTPDGPSIL